MKFRLWLENEARNASKNPLYPPGYGGKGLYPPAYFMNFAADSVTFYTPEEWEWKPYNFRYPFLAGSMAELAKAKRSNYKVWEKIVPG